MSQPRQRVIFVCTHNSARSIMAEALFRAKAGHAFEVHSAGTEATAVRPLTLRVLEDAGVSTRGLHSKSLGAFTGQRFDFVITVCDAAAQSRPTVPGDGVRLHWSFPDPSEASGSERQRLAVFETVLAAIEARVDGFIEAPTQPSSS